LRSPAEIGFRLRQELRNGLMAVAPKRLPAKVRAPSPLPGLPDPRAVAGALRGTAFADAVLRDAEQVLQHRFPLLGVVIETGPEIRWRRDYVSGIESGTDYFRLIPYLDAARAGDHKIIWELNRHQHLVLLAQAWLFSGNRAYLDEIEAQLRSWVEANPFHRGINWASALEVAFRAVSWMWVWHLAANDLREDVRRLLLEGMYQHGAHVANNLSHYFSPNTHLLGEAVAMHALGCLIPQLPNARRWRELGRRIVHQQMRRQVFQDGVHFEQSAYYHVYALDMFLFHSLLEPAEKHYVEKLSRMADYLQAIMGPGWKLPLIGDDDGGRFFHPYGARDEFGRATLATCGRIRDKADLAEQAAWWRGPAALGLEPAPQAWRSHLYPEAGVAVMTGAGAHIVADAGPFGPWSAGHSHSDTLSLVVRHERQEILIDPGTYTYVGDRALRDWFRGSAAHNTIRINGRDQAIPVNPFRWEEKPRVLVHEWFSSEERDRLDAECVYGGFTHRRVMELVRGAALLILDEIRGPAGEHDIEQLWHPASAAAATRLVLEPDAAKVESWRSCAFGERHPSIGMRVARRARLPLFLGAIVLLGARSGEVRNEGGKVRFVLDGIPFTL
jgi:hypothetical protein